MTHTGPFDLSKSPIHLPGSAASSALPLTGFGFDGPSFEAYIEAHCQDDPGHLMMIETTTTDWSSWECHPQGDEIVYILEGAGEFIQEIDGTSIRTRIAPGVTVINPRGVWHTADVEKPMKAIYITPCPDTRHKPR